VVAKMLATNVVRARVRHPPPLRRAGCAPCVCPPRSS
jgi:hypothetical protein